MSEQHSNLSHISFCHCLCSYEIVPFPFQGRGKYKTANSHYINFMDFRGQFCPCVLSKSGYYLALKSFIFPYYPAIAFRFGWGKQNSRNLNGFPKVIQLINVAVEMPDQLQRLCSNFYHQVDLCTFRKAYISSQVEILKLPDSTSFLMFYLLSHKSINLTFKNLDSYL